MKALMFALLTCATPLALAGQYAPGADTPGVDAPGVDAPGAGEVPVEHYNYSTSLDIARVVSMEAIPNRCEVVPMQMVYDDSHGQRHVLEYEVMGNGCTD